ncbi:MAG: hypothetical protein A2776_00945 [Candidatus Levybacteria bacterium RIFCSPHIGHO2_01_FULL_40_10]|nr:MAG: hypothetical protein A2776_00945 [Candidatus Levybacteria bacterium RIFCSPHIGHO2_01_FULL_40_10]
MILNFLKKQNLLILLILVSLLPLLSLLQPGLPITHDGQDHVARIANFYTSLTEGNLVPRWAGNLNWGYGHPILMFLYPLSSYSASFFHFLGFSLVDSVKLVFAGAFILSGVFMYMWIRDFLGEKAGFVAAILYMFAPYRFIDLYVRGAIGEHMAFVFVPLICFLLLKISKTKKFNSLYFVFSTLSFTGLILSHNALLIMFLPFILFYAAYLVFESKIRSTLILQFAGVFILGFGVSAFFIVPAFLEGKYTLRDIVTKGVALGRFVALKDLIYSPWNFGQTGQFSTQVGLAGWFSAILSPIILFRLRKKNKSLFLFFGFVLIFFLLSIFIMLPVSSFLWQGFSTLQKFQFPWRFLSVSIFCTAILSGFIVYSLQNKKLQTVTLVLAVFLGVFLTKDFWYPKGYLIKSETFYTQVYDGTTDTGESAPIWSVRFMEKRPKAEVEVIAGAAQIKKISRNSTIHKYEIESKGQSRIRENTLYFPGWKVYLDKQELNDIQFQDSTNRGLITFYVPDGKHIISLVFENTKLRLISNLITAGSIVALCVILIFYFIKPARNK